MARNNRNRNKGQESTTINNSILDELKDISSDETLVETLEKEEENTNEVEEITEIIDTDTPNTEQENIYEAPLVDVVEKSDEIVENNEVISKDNNEKEEDKAEEVTDVLVEKSSSTEKKQANEITENLSEKATTKEVKKKRLTMKEVFGYEWMGMNYDF